MNVINDLSSDLAQAFLIDDQIGGKLDPKDAKSFIAVIEAELVKLVSELRGSRDSGRASQLDMSLSH